MTDRRVPRYPAPAPTPAGPAPLPEQHGMTPEERAAYREVKGRLFDKRAPAGPAPDATCDLCDYERGKKPHAKDCPRRPENAEKRIEWKEPRVPAGPAEEPRPGRLTPRERARKITGWIEEATRAGILDLTALEIGISVEIGRAEGDARRELPRPVAPGSGLREALRALAEDWWRVANGLMTSGEREQALREHSRAIYALLASHPEAPPQPCGFCSACERGAPCLFVKWDSALRAMAEGPPSTAPPSPPAESAPDLSTQHPTQGGDDAENAGRAHEVVQGEGASRVRVLQEDGARGGDPQRGGLDDIGPGQAPRDVRDAADGRDAHADGARRALVDEVHRRVRGVAAPAAPEVDLGEVPALADALIHEAREEGCAMSPPGALDTRRSALLSAVRSLVAPLREALAEAAEALDTATFTTSTKLGNAARARGWLRRWKHLPGVARALAPGPGASPTEGGRYVLTGVQTFALPERCPECDYRSGFHREDCSRRPLSPTEGETDGRETKP